MKLPFFTLVSLGLLSCSSVQAETPGAVTKLTGKSQSQEFAVKTANKIDYKIIFYRDDVFRVLAAPGGKFADPKNDSKKAQILIVDKPEKVDVKVKEDDQKIEWATSKLKLSMDKKTSAMTLIRPNGEVLWKEVKPLDIEEKITVQTLSTTKDEHFFGGGQQNGSFTHKGTKIEIRADGNWNEGGKPNPAPFYLSDKGYGVLRDTFSTGNYDFTGETSIALDHQEQRFDAYYFVGDDFKRIVDLYTQFTGRPNFVPIWALEMGEADAYMTRDKKTKELVKNPDGTYVETTVDVIDRLAKKYREHDMPGGWILPNDGYGCGYTELPKVVKELHKLGFYTGLWTEKDIKQTKWEVGTAGIRVQKLDVAWTGPAYQFSLDANHQAWTSLTTNSDSRGFVWTVQGWAGTQRYSICWTGDQYGSWDLIRYHVPTLIGSGMSGQAYATTDVDGIFGGSPETYTRDLQWKCFTPVLYAMNGWAGKISKSPWAYPEPYISINRKYLKLKLRMTPYMYKYTREAYDTGAPIVRGMVWEFPDDQKTYTRDTQHQYMLGESLLVAPVYTSQKINKGWRKEDIYLPKGQWVDYWDGRRIQGPFTIDAYPAPLEKLPILVKAGAIIPMYPEMLYNNQKPKDPVTFDVYPHGESQFEMYEDDGLTQKYKTEFAKQMITVKAPQMTEAGDVEIHVAPPAGTFDGQLKNRVYQFQVHVEVKPNSVAFNGTPLNEVKGKDALASAKSGWYFNSKEKRGVAHVKLDRMDVSKDAVVKLDIDESLKIAASPAYPVPEVTPDVDKTQFKVVASSQSPNSPITNAFDGTTETIWHSEYNKTRKLGEYPYTVDIELGALYAVNGFNYLPRPTGSNGLLKDYEIYVSRTPSDFGEPVAKGSFSAGHDLKQIKFKTKWGEYMRLRFLSPQAGPGKDGKKHIFATAAEFDVMQDLKAAPLKDEILYLSDMKPASSKGEFKNDKSYGGKGIVVNGQSYKKGIGALSGSEIVYKLDGSWDKLKGHVGMDDEVGDKGSVMFRVYGDGKILFESPEQTGKSIKQLMELDIKGVKELKLILLDLGDGSDNDHGDWVDAQLIKKGSE